MIKMAFFLKDIDSEDYQYSLSSDEQAALDRYLREMELGPADGEMDIDWQDNGQGYYAHLHELHNIDDKQARSQYRQDLLEDIKKWMVREPNNYMVANVREILGEESSHTN